MTHGPASRAAGESRVREVLDGLVAEGVVPGGVAAVVRADGELLFEQAFGWRTRTPSAEPATLDTLYDCASLTKPLVTAAACLRERAAGRLRFESPVDEFVPELRGAGAPRLPTLGELLLHSGGLPSWEPLYAVAPGGLAARAAWLGSQRVLPGAPAVYGCPGYQVLGLALERATGTSLAALAAGVLGESAGDAFFPVPARLAAGCAPTEDGNVFECDLAGERAAGYEGFRVGVIRGETHDHNSHTLGGAAGNAGLFATARGVARLAAEFLRPDETYSAATLRELQTCLSPRAASGTGGGEELRTWGFQLARSAGSSAGPALSERAFGHSGFTGTSVWIDPERDAAFVLLTNRVHPHWKARAFNADRARFHAAATELLDVARD